MSPAEERASSLELRRRTFDGVAEAYDRFRPGYPATLIEDVVRLSEIPPRGSILEIGCGTGKATAPFAGRGYRMTCLEPGANLARLAERNLARFPHVAIVRSTFEDWPAAGLRFDLVLAAQSFHFIEARAGLSKAADLLCPQGAIAIFAYHPRRGESAVHRRVQEAYAEHAPALLPRDEDAGFADRIDEVGRFDTVIMTRYRWTTVYTAEQYAGLMGTQSDHNLLRAETRAALLEAIRRAILAHGDTIAVDFVARLFLARRRPAAPGEPHHPPGREHGP